MTQSSADLKYKHVCKETVPEYAEEYLMVHLRKGLRVGSAEF